PAGPGVAGGRPRPGRLAVWPQARRGGGGAGQHDGRSAAAWGGGGGGTGDTKSPTGSRDGERWANRARPSRGRARGPPRAPVREHTESTMRQYGLVEEAVRLGWPRSDVEVIDTDLGISGRFGVMREGFTELVGKVCSGEVGAIFGIEISRLARSNADVARLMEFARITGTLLIDADGVYDPGDINDRMLLGLKGTMGEVELHVMAGRLQDAKPAAAGRGELRTPLPVGFLYDSCGEPGHDTVIDPDAEVQAAIADVFTAFAACGSAYGVVTAFADRKFPLRAYGGVW